MTLETILSICLGIGLAASVGFCIFIPLLGLSLASYFDLWELNDQWQWLGSLTAVLAFGIATLVEILGYFIPYIDNLLDTIAIPLAALTGTAVMVSTVADLSPLVTWSLAIIAGGGTATAIKGSTATTRLASTTSTAGVTNPIVSTVETGTSVIMSVISIFLPILAILFVVLIFIFIFKVFKKIKRIKQ